MTMRRPSGLVLAAVLAVGFLISSCASEPPSPQLPPTPKQATATAADSNYIIGPGDTLQVFVWRNPELSTTVPVRPDGKISTPLIEDMVAVGKTSPQLARDMEGVLAEYVRAPKVNIIVTIAASAFSQVKVVGQVVHAQELPYREGMTVLDAVLSVGGLSQFAAGNRAHIVRIVNGQETTIKVKLDDLVNNGDTRQNLPLKPGDLLVVPQSLF
jgi:polysaccharide biosynthesis/export protein